MVVIALLLIAATVPSTEPASELTDSARLLQLHGAAMQAHLDQDVEAILEDESEDYVVASRGQVDTPTKQERRDLLGPYLAGTNFTVYRDEIEPIVRVSDDGTLGWVIVRVYARGTQTTPSGESRPIEFTSAWIELYEKRDDNWMRVGNVSNFEE